MNVKSTQYFLEHHYAAFDDPKPYSDEDPERKERMIVSDALRNLHDQIVPFIRNHRNWDLHWHHQTQHQVSSYHFFEIENGPRVTKIPSMWTHFGKSRNQLSAYRELVGVLASEKDQQQSFYDAFYVHTRIQFYINSSVFRSWLILTDNNLYDRRAFRENVVRNKDQRWSQMYWLRLSDIFDKGYFYEIDCEQLPLVTGLTWNEFQEFIKKEKKGVYSGIVKEYDPNDERINRKNIINELQSTLMDLYPLYNLMSFRIGNIPDQKPKAQDLSKLFGGNVKVTRL